LRRRGTDDGVFGRPKKRGGGGKRAKKPEGDHGKEWGTTKTMRVKSLGWEWDKKGQKKKFANAGRRQRPKLGAPKHELT